MSGRTHNKTSGNICVTIYSMYHIARFVICHSYDYIIRKCQLAHMTKLAVTYLCVTMYSKCHIASYVMYVIVEIINE